MSVGVRRIGGTAAVCGGEAAAVGLVAGLLEVGEEEVAFAPFGGVRGTFGVELGGAKLSSRAVEELVIRIMLNVSP